MSVASCTRVRRQAYSSKNRICDLNKLLDSYPTVRGNYTEKVFVTIITSQRWKRKDNCQLYDLDRI